jgi:hypothetical protein
LQKELNHQGKPAFIYQNKPGGRAIEYQVNGQVFYGYHASFLQSVNRVEINYMLIQGEMSPGDTLMIDFEMANPTSHDIHFNHAEFPVSCIAVYAVRTKLVNIIVSDCAIDRDITLLPAKATVAGTLKTVVPDLSPEGYFFTLSLYNTICYAVNSDLIRIKVK